MYKMGHFTENNMDAVLAFMKKNNFVTLTGNADGRSVATQVPVLFSERDGKVVIRGHIMRKTDHHLAFEKNPQALVLFTGPHCYVSASWYSERGHGSTWNYMTVHVRGEMKFLTENETLNLLKELTHKYEDGQEQPELTENMTAQYLQSNVKAIVAFELVAEDIYPLFKLSQNRDDESYENIVRQLLHSEGNDEIIDEMMERRPRLNYDISRE
jgi:transcriptional regulator